ncbi:3257_t:CDS:1, partial [Ambispora gerdemannii]
VIATFRYQFEICVGVAEMEKAGATKIAVEMGKADAARIAIEVEKAGAAGIAVCSR